MKILKSVKRAQEASALLVALILCAIMGITLASYLVMTQAQNVSVMRSQTWNASMALTEAGIEDGLALINKYNGLFETLPLWTNTATSDNYQLLANGQYYVKRYVDANGWGTNSYEVFINPNNNNPIVTAIGYVNWKHSYASTAPQSYYAAASPNQQQSPSLATAQASRKVSVMTKFDPLFAVAMAALQTIDLNGNNTTTDSFDSEDPAHSISGLYPYGNISMVKSNGDIATTASIVSSISVGNANIKGKAKTGPNGTVSIGPNGYVTGGTYDDFNVQFPNVVMPGGTYFAVPNNPQTINGVTYDYVITGSGNWWLNGLTKNLYIQTNATVVLYVTGNVNLTGSSDQIRIGQGAQVKWYQLGSTFSVKGNGIVNENGNAQSFYYYGLPSNTSVNFGGNGGFTGAIYAPQAAFTLGGGGNNVYDFIGASVTRNVKLNGHFNFHYDEALRKKGPGRGYIPTDWREQPAS